MGGSSLYLYSIIFTIITNHHHHHHHIKDCDESCHRIRVCSGPLDVLMFWLLKILMLHIFRVLYYQTWYLSIFLHQHTFKILKIYPKKRVNRNILNTKLYIFGVLIHLFGIISQFSYISAHFTHVQWVNSVWYYQKLNHIASIGPKTHPQNEILPEW